MPVAYLWDSDGIFIAVVSKPSKCETTTAAIIKATLAPAAISLWRNIAVTLSIFLSDLSLLLFVHHLSKEMAAWMTIYKTVRVISQSLGDIPKKTRDETATAGAVFAISIVMEMS